MTSTRDTRHRKPGSGADLPPVEQLRAWSLERQRLGHRAVDASSALTDVVAVYSAHPTAPLALWARTAEFTSGDLEALERDRRAIRIVGMRGSAFLVPVASVDDMVAATRIPLRPAYLRGRGLDASTYEELKPRVLEAASRPITPTELREAMGSADGDTRPYFAMRAMAREGLVIRIGTGRVRSDDLRWVSTEAWLGRPFHDRDAGAARSSLAAAYLAAYGPARVVDFGWWAGIPSRAARDAISSVPTIDVGGGLLLPNEHEASWRATGPVDPDRLDVVPKWDAYTMGYAPDGRARFVDDRHLPLAYSTADTRIGATAGDGMPLILKGGRAVASWTHRLDRDRMIVTLVPFEANGRTASDLRDRVVPEFEAIAGLMAARVEVILAET